MIALTEEIGVREPVESDAQEIVDAVRASLPELRPWMPWAKDDYGLDDADAWIRGDFGDVHRGVLFEQDGRVAGVVGINGVDELNRLANLGYWIRSDMAGRGLATLATRWMARRGLREEGLERLEILMAVENEASRRVAEKVGAHYEGIARRRVRVRDVQQDAHVFSLVLSDLDD